MITGLLLRALPGPTWFRVLLLLLVAGVLCYALWDWGFNLLMQQLRDSTADGRASVVG